MKLSDDVMMLLLESWCGETSSPEDVQTSSCHEMSCWWNRLL